MAKQNSVKIKLESSAGTGYYYVTKKNSRTMTDKMVIKKYDPFFNINNREDLNVAKKLIIIKD